MAAVASAGGSYGVVPVLRNWGDDGVVRTDLLDNLLISEGICEPAQSTPSRRWWLATTYPASRSTTAAWTRR